MTAPTITVGGRTVVHGFDWSQWQRPRDLAGVTATQAFAVFKATEGDTFGDPAYLAHVANADAAGLIHGAYHFARPDWSDGSPFGDGRQEARQFLDRLAPTERFAVLDLEATVLDAARTTDYVRGWLDELEASRRFPLREQRVIYVGKFFAWYHAVDVAGRAVLWIPWYTAGYSPNVDPAAIPLPGWSVDLWPEGWAIWQYSSSGTVAGVHPSDVNVATVEWWQAVAGDTPTDPQPFPAPEVHDMAAPVFTLPEKDWIIVRGFAPAGPYFKHVGMPELQAMIADGVVNVADVRPLTSTPDLTEQFETAPLYGPDGALIRGPQR